MNRTEPNASTHLDVHVPRLPKALSALGVQRLRVQDGQVVGVYVPEGRARSDFGPGWRTAGRSAPRLLIARSESTRSLLARVRLPKAAA